MCFFVKTKHAEKLSEYRASVLCLSWGSKVTCLGLGSSSGFNSADQNSSNWHQDPSAHWINPPLSSIWMFFLCFLYQLHPFLYSFSWLLKGERCHALGLVCVEKNIFQRFQVHHVQTVGSLAVIFSLSLPLLSLSPSLSLFLRNRSFVCKELKRSRKKNSELCWQHRQSRNAAGERDKRKARNPPLSHRQHSWPWGHSELAEDPPSKRWWYTEEFWRHNMALLCRPQPSCSSESILIEKEPSMVNMQVHISKLE